MDLAHRRYDAVSFGESMDQVRTQFSEEEVDIAFSVMEAWLGVRREVQQKRLERQKQKKREQKLAAFGNGNVTEHGAERGDFLVRLYFLKSVTKCRKVPFISLRYENCHMGYRHGIPFFNVIYDKTLFIFDRK